MTIRENWRNKNRTNYKACIKYNSAAWKKWNNMNNLSLTFLGNFCPFLYLSTLQTPITKQEMRNKLSATFLDIYDRATRSSSLYCRIYKGVTDNNKLPPYRLFLYYKYFMFIISITYCSLTIRNQLDFKTHLKHNKSTTFV